MWDVLERIERRGRGIGIEILVKGVRGHCSVVRTRSDTTPVKLRSGPDLVCFPLVLVHSRPRPPLRMLPRCPPFGLCSSRRNSGPVPDVFPCFRCSLELWTFACCSLPWTRSGLLRSFSGLCRLRYVTTLVRVSPLRDRSPLYALGLALSLD